MSIKNKIWPSEKQWLAATTAFTAVSKEKGPVWGGGAAIVVVVGSCIANAFDIGGNGSSAAPA